MKAAVIGLGSIGGLIAHRLAERGVPLAVFDLRPDAGDETVAATARRAVSCADAAADADIVILAVVDDQQVLDAVSGTDGVLANAKPGTIIVIHSTVRLNTVREVTAMAARHGLRVLDAGVSTLGPHERGSLAMFVGGAKADVDAARPVLEHYADPLDHVGPVGSGMTAKLLRNLLGYTLMAAAHEALALAENVGVDLDQFRRVLTESDVLSQLRGALSVPTTRPVTESDAALNFIKHLAAGRDSGDLIGTLEHSVSIMEKDTDDALAFAEDAGVTLALAPHVRPLLRRVMLLPTRD